MNLDPLQSTLKAHLDQLTALQNTFKSYMDKTDAQLADINKRHEKTLLTGDTLFRAGLVKWTGLKRNHPADIWQQFQRKVNIMNHARPTG